MEKEGEVRGLESAWMRNDKKVLFVRENAKAIRDEDGKISYYEGTAEDITERKTAALELEKSRQKFIDLFESAPDSIVTLDLKGFITSCNQAATRLPGYSKEELIGKHFSNLGLIKINDIPKYLKLFNSILRGKIPEPIEVTFIHKEGTHHTVEAHIALLKEEGKITGVQVVSRDITERKKSEQIQSVLYKIANAVNTTKDMPELFRSIHKELGTILDTTNFFISLYDKETDTLSLPYYVDEKDRFTSFPVVKTKTSYVIKKKEPVLVTQKLREKLIRAGEIEVFGTPSKIWLGVPLKIGGEVIGVVAVQSYTDPHAYGEKEMEILKFVSEEIALVIERKKAEEALRKSEEKYRALFEGSLHPVTIYDRNANIVMLNQIGAENLKKPLSEIIGKPLKDFIPETHELTVKRVREVLETGKPLFVEDEISLPQAKHWFLSTLHPVLNPKGQPDLVQVISYDITERKKAEESICEALEKRKELEFIINKSPSIVFLWKAAEGWPVEYVSDNISLLGYTIEDFIAGRIPYSQVVHPEDLERVGAEVSRYSKEGVAEFTQEYRIITKVGEVKWVDDRTWVRRDSSGVITHYQGIILDITERKKAEEALKENEEKYRNLVELSPNLVGIHDDKGVIKFMNQRGIKMLKASSKDEVIGKHIFDFIEPEEKENNIRLRQQVFKKGTIENLEGNLKCLDGTVIDTETWGVPLIYEGESSIMVIIQDITERKKAEQALRKSEERYRIVADNTYDWEFWINPEGQFLYDSPSCQRITGHNAEEFACEPNLLHRLIHPEDHERFMLHEQQVMEKKTPSEIEFRIVLANGTIRYISHVCQPVFDEQGQYLGNRGSNRDITEHKRAEEALMISEKRYRLLFERNLAGVFHTTLDGRILDCNDSVVHMFGYGSREELMSHQMWDVYPERKEREKFLSLLMKQKILINHEICLKRKDGSLLWCLTNASLLEDKDSGFSTIEGTLIDITERKKAMELLQTSQAQLSNAMKIAKLGYWEYDVAKDLFTFDDHFYAIFRTTAEKVGGYTMSSARYAELFVHPDDRPLVGIEVRKALESTEPHFSRQLEHRIIYADGGTGYITVRFFIVKDDKGNTVRTYGANQDITERKQAEEALRESEQRYRGVVDNIGIGVSLISPKMEILFLNKQMRKWFSNVDISKKAVCYRAFNNPPRDEICSYCPTCKTLQDAQVHEAITDTPSGNQIINYRVISSPIIDKNGKVTSAIEMVEDITERKKLQEQLIRTEKLAAVGTLSYGIAHEFNNIMAGILINSELGLATGEPQQIKECFQTIAENSQRASSITNNLLAFARQKEAKKELIDVTEPLKSVLAITRRELEKLNIVMEEKFKPVPKIYCDAGQFSEVFLNMITNARDAMRPRGGKLIIQVDSLKDDFRIIFQDTGCGIPEKLGNKIFEPFVTTKGALGKSDVPGTGLGLFLSYGIIDGYKGKIEVESKVGRGTKFTILIPISKNQPEKSTGDTAVESSAEVEKKLNILLVDDEKSITLSLKRYLESRGYQVTASLKAREGLKLFQKDKFDLVLSDILMPDMDGIELIQKIREKNKDSRIIVMTGQILKEKEEEAREAGADEVLIKPFRNEILSSTINRVMTKSEAEN